MADLAISTGFCQLLRRRGPELEPHRPRYHSLGDRGKIGDLPNSDFVMRRVFRVGVDPELSEEMLAFAISILRRSGATGSRAAG
jgi:hypothetical protein